MKVNVLNIVLYHHRHHHHHMMMESLWMAEFSLNFFFSHFLYLDLELNPFFYFLFCCPSFFSTFFDRMNSLPLYDWWKSDLISILLLLRLILLLMMMMISNDQFFFAIFLELTNWTDIISDRIFFFFCMSKHTCNRQKKRWNKNDNINLTHYILIY